MGKKKRPARHTAGKISKGERRKKKIQDKSIKEKIRAQIKAGKRLYKIVQDVEKSLGISDTKAIGFVYSEYRETIQAAAN